MKDKIATGKEKGESEMKRIMFLLVLFLGFAWHPQKAVSQTTYTVQILPDDIWWWSKESWGIWVHAEIDSNGHPITNPQNYWYYWYNKVTGTRFASQTGTDSTQIDQNVDSTDGLTIYVIATDTVNHKFTDIKSTEDYNSGTALVGYRPQLVQFHAYQSNGAPITPPYGQVTAYHWRWTMGKWMNGYYGSWLTLNYNEVLRATPNYASSISQKLNNWNHTATNVQNWQTFSVTTSLDSLVAQYYPPDGTSVISDSLIGTTISGSDSVQLTDPWLNDPTDNRFYQSPYGYHSLGMSSPFKSRQTPYFITISSSDTGVFQAQTVSSGIYYTIRAPLVKAINNHLAFFAGWIASNANLTDAGPNATTGYDSAAVVFSSSNAKVVAKYSNSTVTYSSTIPSGSWSAAGNITVPSGVTLTTGQSTTVSFPSGALLTVKGKLTANGTTYSFTSAQPYVSGITLSGATNSSLTNCTISGADLPIAIDTTSGVTVSGCTINSSSFNSSNAILISDCNPTISNTDVNGGGSSSNGVRYENGAGGTMSSCTISGCGVGNGIVIQGNSSPTISSCSISSNAYYGIIVNSDGSGYPTFQSNILSSNGSGSYHNLLLQTSSSGLMLGNTLENGFAGLGVYGGSYVSSVIENVRGNNIIYNNTYGILCAGTSSAVELGDSSGKYYRGICNQIYSNSTYNVDVWGGGSVVAKWDWWGRNPPDTTKFSGSALTYKPYLTSSGGCPLGGSSPVLAEQSTQSLSPDQLSSLTPDALLMASLLALPSFDFSTATLACRTVLSDNATTAQKQAALGRLCTVFLLSGDTTIVTDLNSYLSTPGDLGETAEELLVTVDASRGQLAAALSLANDLIAKYAGTDVEKRALLLIASFSAFDPSYKGISASAINSLETKFSSSLDQGLIAALSTTPIASTPTSKSMKGGMESDVVAPIPKNFELENYPNPFNPTTIIRYALPTDSRVTIKVYDMIGREVATLVDGDETQGYHEVTFDGSRYASGVYLYRLTAPNVTITMKMLLTK